jgi:hypothetical protein
MIYFVLGVAGAALIDREARALLRSPALWIALPIAAVLMLPNALWVLNNGLVTLHHVGGNITGEGVSFNLVGGLEFLASQFVVFGPIIFAVLLIILVRVMQPEITRADRLLLCFVVPALALVTVTAFTTRAFANWAAVSCIAATIVAAAVLVRKAEWRWIAVSIALGAAAQVALLISDANARRLSLPFLPKPDIYERTMGWRALGDGAAALARRIDAATVVGEGRDDVASLIYYVRDSGRQVLAWPSGVDPEHHFDLTRRLTPAAAEPVLLISRCDATERLAKTYRSVEPVGTFQAASGPHTMRSYYGYKLSGALAEIVPHHGC